LAAERSTRTIESSITSPGEIGAQEPLDPATFRASAAAIEREVARVIVGQHEAVRGVLLCLIAGGHALLEGVPGVGKTSMARAFSQALSLSHSRVQFTPDLMPADITGTTVFIDDPQEGLRSQFHRGPVFSALLLADEINRASPRTQSALLEAMQESTVTIAGLTHELPRPFCVLATQNPIEMHGTYPLPEAQLDRFLLKVRFSFPSREELVAIVDESDEINAEIEPVADAARLLAMGALAHQVPTASQVLEHLGALIFELQPSESSIPLVRDYVRLGPSPRAAQALSIAGRATALLEGRHHLAVEDIHAVAMPVLRHRLILNFDAERDAITPETVIAEALTHMPEHPR
jgi:MoxR-like ATPase